MSLRLTLAMAAALMAAFGAVLGAAAAVGFTRPSDPAAAADARADDGAAAFARRVVRLIAENRYDEAWPLLHPAHRADATRAEYVSCEGQSPIPGRLVSERAGSAVDEPVVIAPGVRVRSRAVPVTVVLLDLATSERAVVNVRVHAVSVDGRWRWVLPAKRLAQYRAGACPDAPPRYD